MTEVSNKQSGLGDNLYIGGYNVSGATQSLNISSPLATIDVTDITQYANARLGGLRAGEITLVTYFDTQMTNSAHSLYSALPRTDVISSYFRGTAVGNPAACMVAKQLNYDGTRGTDGSLTAAVDMQSNGYGLEWCKQLTAGVRTDTTATAGAYYDNATSYAYGLQAYLQVFAITGTSVTVEIQHCATSGGSYTTLGSFTAVSAAPAAQRLVVSNTTTVDRYLKVTTTGTFTNAQFAVAVNVNPVAGIVF